MEKSTSLDNRENGNRYRMYSSQGIFMGVYEYQEEKALVEALEKCLCRMEKETNEIYSRYSGF